MLFNSREFILLFLPIVLSLFLWLWKRGWTRAAVNSLTLASLVFYGWWNPAYLMLIAGSIVTNFLFGRALDRKGGDERPRTGVLVLGLAFNLTLLGYFKYANFLVDTVNAVASTDLRLAKITLPLAISFFTFQQISFLVDTWKKGGLHYSFERYAAYVTFFPHEIAGPIVRHYELIPQFDLDPWREGFWERMGRGVSLFAIGLVKKVFIADPLAGIVNPIYAATAATTTLGMGDAWIGAIGFAWQIYFDFSAYTDMALGIALLFGYTLPINFDRPYRSTSIRELWGHWHMTLSRFLRDYLFIPLATNRWLPQPRFLGMIITMFLAGLWHGAAWTFAVWGAMQGLALAFYTLIDRRFRAKLPEVVGWLLTMLFWFETVPLFRADSFASAITLWRAMHGGGPPSHSVTPETLALLTIAGVIAIAGPSSQTVAVKRLQPHWYVATAFGTAVFAALFSIWGEVEQEFIYFQF
jgi:D-alanyl-lipoteichoic acid acyltransferase DltB (MBOAT superfamily)